MHRVEADHLLDALLAADVVLAAEEVHLALLQLTEQLLLLLQVFLEHLLLAFPRLVFHLLRYLITSDQTTEPSIPHYPVAAEGTCVRTVRTSLILLSWSRCIARSLSMSASCDPVQYKRMSSRFRKFTFSLAIISWNSRSSRSNSAFLSSWSCRNNFLSFPCAQ